MNYFMIPPCPSQMAVIEKNGNKCLWGCGESGTLIHCWWECQLLQLLWKSVLQFLKELRTELPALLLLCKHPKDSLFYHRDTRASMLLASHIHYKGKDLGMASMSIRRQIDKENVYIHNEFYSVIMKKMKLAGKWMDLDRIILNKVTQTQKDKNQVFLCSPS